MGKEISIIFAYRNRDVHRIEISMNSLNAQYKGDFEVIFVDYGSEPDLSAQVTSILSKYEFCNYHFLNTSQLLWNKCKALNYGIKKAGAPYVFIADVDIIFSPLAISFLKSQCSGMAFRLFKMGYLSEKQSSKISTTEWNNIKAERIGDVNGMLLTSTESLFKVSGYDEFYHFYGSEDVDLCSRLENAGYKSKMTSEVYFYHNWHLSYQGAETKKLTYIPRISNAMRINEQHHLYNKRKNILIPDMQTQWGVAIDTERVETLEKPEFVFELPNIAAAIDHFFNEEINYIHNKIIEVQVSEAEYYRSIKYKIKKKLGRESQLYIPLKEVNDIILKHIIFRYRHFNYSYRITQDLQTIIFKIEL